MALPFIGREKVLGGEIVSRILAAEGVDTVFGIIDGSYFGFYASLPRCGIRIVTPRHETSAAHMAGAYARLTGRLGVCMASNGPGVANILPGVAVEHAEGNRVLLVTSSRRQGITYPDRGGTYQYFPHVDVIGAMAKWSCAVPTVDRLAELVRRALRVSFIGRPGVVHLDIPESILNTEVEVQADWMRAPERSRAHAPLEAPRAQVEEAARMLMAAKLPLLHVGSGVTHANATDEVHELAELIGAAITTSWGARAAVDERRREVVSMVYVDAVSRARNAADVALVLGSRLGETDWWGKAPYWAPPERQRLIQVDLDAEVLGNNRPVDLAIQSDVKTFLRALLDELRAQRSTFNAASIALRRSAIDELVEACRARRAALDAELADPSLPMKTAHVPHLCQKLFPDDAVVVHDGGNTVIWGQFYHQVRVPGSMLGTAKMGMLGAGVSQALGAQVARPDKAVYCIIGDGAMGFHPQEIETAVRNRLPVVYLVIVDKQWGMVKINQQFALKPLKTLVFKTLGPDENINTDLGEIRWDELGRSMGAFGERVADPDGLAGAIQRARASGLPAVIHVDVDPVRHMWAPNLRTFKDMHQEPKA
jgi:acetolactate synthase-1/2/3 large subunit